MPIKILMPALSPTMTEGNLAKWLKKEGDKVSPGEVIAEIETDKAVMEVEAVDEGIMSRVLVAAGTENVAVNSLIAILLEDGEDASLLDDFIASNITKSQSSSTKETLKSEPTSPLVAPIPTAATIDDTKPVAIQQQNINLVSVSNATAPSLGFGGRVFASPLAKNIAKLNNINLANIAGSGPHGRIVKADVLNYSSKTMPGQVRRNPEEYRLVPNNSMRKVIAKRLVESKQTIPHFYLSVECNLDKLLEVRRDINRANQDDAAKRISVNDLVILAVAKSLKEVPEANSSWADSSICYYNNIDIAVAVAISGGLITPIIRNADQKDIIRLSSEMKELAARAKDNKLLPEEFQGGGFSISNLGMYGVKSFNAIINPPQACILAIGSSAKRPVVIDDQIKIANIMDVTLSCDHRVVDGAVGAKFLASFKKHIESPILMMI
jgi:pyruvate dehydrogenase E2 component (dihydrolipoamide acetyltransferase)